MKNRAYVVKLNKIYGIRRDTIGGTRVLSGVFITTNRGASVVDAGGDFFAYQKMGTDAYFLFHLDGQWYDQNSPEAEEIMDRHWKEDNL